MAGQDWWKGKRIEANVCKQKEDRKKRKRGRIVGSYFHSLILYVFRLNGS